MSAPYRQDLDALRERLTQLEAEIARLRAFGAELEKVRAEESALAKEAEDVRRRLEGSGKRALPLLDQVKVASPCSAKWEDMLGDERVRFCLACEKNVFNLSAMPREEAESLLAAKASGELCVRYYQRADGTIMTRDCPVGVTKKRRKKLALAVASAGAMAAAAVTALRAQPTCTLVRHAPVQGAMVALPPEHVDEPQPHVMGEIEPVITPPPVERPTKDEPTPHIMGRMPARR